MSSEPAATSYNIEDSQDYRPRDGSSCALIREVYPSICHDMKKHTTCTFDTFLKFVLAKVDRGSTLDADERLENTLQASLIISNHEYFQTLVKRYCEPVHSERARYGPFVETFNTALSCLEDLRVQDCAYRRPDDIRMRFCRNADAPEMEIYAMGLGRPDDDRRVFVVKRRPEVILTSTAALCRMHGRRPLAESELRDAAQRRSPQHYSWYDTLAAVGFKLVEDALEAPDVPDAYGTSLQSVYGAMDVYSEAKTQLIPTGPSESFEGATRNKNSRPPRNAEVMRKLRSYQENAQQHPSVLSQDMDTVQEEYALYRPPPAMQTAVYGTEMLSRAPAISHAISMVIFDSVVHVWWYDREGAIQTTGLDFLTDLPRFLALLFALQRFNAEDWGLIPDFDLGGIQALTDQTKPRACPQETTIRGARNRAVRVQTGLLPVYKTLCLQGKGTWVFASRCPGFNPEDPLNDLTVTKLSWQDCTRDSETAIIQKAIDRANSNRMIIDHMPIVVDETQYDRYTTATVRRQLGIPLRTRRLGGPDGAEVESYRVLRSTTMERLIPLTRLSGDVFVDAWFQCAEVHYLNWMNGIHHQDLSLENLMYRTRGNTIYAVLNDWDLAIDTTLPQMHTDLEMTGTVPFMAIEHLTPEALTGEVRHLYRHDLESLFYILLWALSCYEDGKRLDSLPETFASWIKDDMNRYRCAKDKHWLLTWEHWPDDIEPKESWGKLGPKLLDVLRTYLGNIRFTRKHLMEEWSTARFMAMPSDDIRSHRPPTEDDAPSKFWEEFCALIKQSIASVLTDDPQLHAELPSRLLSLVDS